MAKMTHTDNTFEARFYALQAAVEQAAQDTKKAEELRAAKAAKKHQIALINAASAALDVEAVGNDVLVRVAEHGAATGREMLAQVATDCGTATTMACKQTVLQFLAIGVKNACDGEKRNLAVAKALDPVGALVAKAAKGASV